MTNIHRLIFSRNNWSSKNLRWLNYIYLIQCIDVHLAEQKNVKIYVAIVMETSAVREIVTANYNHVIAFLETSFPESRLGYENQ